MKLNKPTVLQSVTIRTQPAPLRVALKTLVLVGLIVGLMGCTKTVQWTEQVRLSDGSSVRVHSSSKNEVTTEIGGPSSAFPVEVRLQILEQSPPAREWVDQLEPILLERDLQTREFVLIATTGDERVWSKRGKPTMPYWQFRLTANGWREEVLSDFVFGKRTNLLLNPFWVDDEDETVTLEMKERWRVKHGAHRSIDSIEREYRFGVD